MTRFDADLRAARAAMLARELPDMHRANDFNDDIGVPRVSDELKRLSDAAAKGPWHYRPREHDDWGLIRGDEAVFDDEESGPPVASAKPIWGDYDFDAHRAAGTDPMAANGRFITELVNAYRAGDLVPAAQLAEAQAREAVAYKVAADVYDDVRSIYWGRTLAEMQSRVVGKIRALAPTETTAALDRIKAEARNAALDEAYELIQTLHQADAMNSILALKTEPTP